MPRPALVVGLTGGIASGKSTVGRLFEAHGVVVVDADQLAREVVAPGSDGLAAVCARFGEDVLDADGALDRSRMRERVFSDPRARADLEAIIHPRVRAAMDERLAEARSAYAMAMIPLLLETGQQQRFDRILVVDVPRDLQIARVQARDGSTLQVVEGILAAQVDRDHRLSVADDVISNDADLASLEAAVARLHERYLALATRAGA